MVGSETETYGIKKYDLSLFDRAILNKVHKKSKKYDLV